MKPLAIYLVFVFILTTTMIDASILTLKSLLQTAKRHNALSKSLDQRALATTAQSLADTASDPLSLNADTTKAVPNSTPSGYEYTIGLSKNIKLGNIQTQERQIAQLQSQASHIEGEKSVLSFRNSLKNLYHQHCLDREKYSSIKQSYRDFLTLYKKKEKAYQYHEISKTELMQLASEKRKLFAQLEQNKMLLNISKQKVLMLSGANSNTKTKLSCRDTYPIRSHIRLGNTFGLSKKAKQKRVQSTQKMIKRYSHSLESLSINGQYGKELDVDRYTIGVSIPLNFSSSKNEHARAAAMYKASSIEYTYAQTMKEKKALLFELKAQLKSQASMIKTLSQNYKAYKNKLLPLVKKSYDLGESSVIEYLLNRQKLYALNQEIYANKKAYYTTLFNLYTLSEKKD